MMKPTKMRNKMIYSATFHTKSKQLGSSLSKDLRKRYGKRSARINKGDSVEIVRGEFKGVTGKVSKVFPDENMVTIEGIKKEKTKGDKFDVHIHSSNLVITTLDTENKWRISKLKDDTTIKGKDKDDLDKEEPGSDIASANVDGNDDDDTTHNTASLTTSDDIQQPDNKESSGGTTTTTTTTTPDNNPESSPDDTTTINKDTKETKKTQNKEDNDN